jgi:hypothetical protein
VEARKTPEHLDKKGFTMSKLTTKRWGARLTAAAATTAAVTLVPTPAHAATCDFGRPTPAGISCTTSYSSGSKVTTIKSGTGTTLRAAFYDSWTTYKGDRILYYGSGNCSASTSDTDFRLAALPDGWNDRISSVEDYHGCDVNLFKDVDFGGGSTGYVNYGEQSTGGGKHLFLTKNNWASSFKIS